MTDYEPRPGETWADMAAADALLPDEPTTLPPGDWDDIPADYREETCNELPVEGGDAIALQDRQAAERLIKRYHRLAEEERETTVYIDDEIARARETLEALEARRAELLAPILRKRAWLDTFRPLLEAWARQALEGAKARSLKLTYGSVRFKAGRTSLSITDEAAALSWAEQECPEAVKVARSVLKTPLMDRIKATGEVIPGVEVVTPPDTFEVEV